MTRSRFSDIFWKLPTALFAVLLASGPAFAQIGYVRSDGINSVVYKGNDNHVYELFLLGNTWQLGDLTAQAGAPLADTYAYPRPYVRSDGVNAVVYTGADAHIYELYLWGGTWYYGDLTAVSGAPVGSTPYPYVRSDRINSVVYVGGNYHIYELYLSGGWHWGDLTALSGAPPVFDGLHPYVSANGINSVLYVAGDGHDSIHQIYDIYLARGAWRFANLTALAGAPDVNHAFVTPHPYVRSDGVDSVVYPRGAQAGWPIYELYPQAGAWQYESLSDLSGAPLGNWNLNPYVRSDGMSAIVYSGGTAQYGGDGHIRELFFDFGGWHFEDLTGQAGAPPVDTYDDPHPYVRSDGLNAVLYWSGGHVIELYWSPAYISWQFEDLTAQAGG